MSTTGWWVLGWVLGVVVVGIAATLLLTVIALGRRVVRQAGEIVSALDGARRNTDALWDVRVTNQVLDRITRGLRAVRERLEAG